MEVYLLQPSWNIWMVVGSYFVSVLGAYTSTQLMCQVATSHRIWKKLTWIAVASFSFGGTGVWAMHFVSMLAMSIGIPVRYEILMTLASAAVAVAATFITFAYELLVKELRLASWPRRLRRTLPRIAHLIPLIHDSDDALPLLPESELEDATPFEPAGIMRRRGPSFAESNDSTTTDLFGTAFTENTAALSLADAPLSLGRIASAAEEAASATSSASNSTTSLSSFDSNTQGGSSATSAELLLDAVDPAYSKAVQAQNERLRGVWGGTTMIGHFLWGLWFSLTSRVIIKGGLLGLTVCAMHYSGMWSMRMDGYIVWDMRLVASSVLVAWVACIVAIIYMPMEPNFFPQVTFSFLAAAGVSVMHYVGMASGTFYTTVPPPHNSVSVPTDLPLMILVMATTSCLLSYAMLAHLVTQSRDRLAEMIMTKRKLWKVIAEKEAFERANRLKSEFISVASHEIRTPLHAISGYTDLLLHTRLTEEQATYLESIKMGCHSIQLITNNVLDFSKLEKGSSESNARPVEVDIRSLAQRVVASCATPHRMSEKLLRRLEIPNQLDKGQPAASITLPSEKNVELVLLIEDDVPAMLFVDEVYVTRVVMNLISNALKFTEGGYVFVHISMEQSSGSSGPLVAICVKDSGIGISSEFKDAIFEPFRQADTSLTRSHTGAGLGLAISRQLCERMGGTIDLWSKEGSGSEFTVRLPALSGRGEPVLSLPHVESTPPPIYLAVAVRSKKTLELLRGLLQKKGFIVRAIDLQHASRAYQPALAKAERLWIDMECLASAPWLYEYVVNLRANARKISCFTIFDEVGTDLGLRATSTLKAAGRVALIRRPIVIHELETRLRTGIPQSDVATSPSVPGQDAEKVVQTPPSSATPPPDVTSDSPTPMIDLHDVSSLVPVLSVPALDGGAAARAHSGQPSPALPNTSPDHVTKALDPLQSVIRETVAAAKAKRVRFENGYERPASAPPPSSSPPPNRGERPPASQDPPQTDTTSVQEAERLCILLVEDNVVNQKLGLRILQKLGYDTDLAENGKVAMDLIKLNRSKYSLVLMDCQMPVMNGFECTRRIRALEATGARQGHLPIIALTANVSSESREECEKAGADHFLPKPLLMEDLKDTIHHYIALEKA